MFIFLQGVLAEMEEQRKSFTREMEDLIGNLRQELVGKDCRVRELTSSMAEMTEKMAGVELSNQTAARRIGRE